MFDKKVFNQELISHIHCSGYIFCQNKKMKFYMSLFDGLYLEFYLLSILYSYYSTKHLYIHYDVLLQQHFATSFAFLCLLLSSTKNEYIFGFNLTNSLIATPVVSYFILSMTNLFELS